jgi:hypothetical protein
MNYQVVVCGHQRYLYPVPLFRLFPLSLFTQCTRILWMSMDSLVGVFVPQQTTSPTAVTT